MTRMSGEIAPNVRTSARPSGLGLGFAAAIAATFLGSRGRPWRERGEQLVELDREERDVA